MTPRRTLHAFACAALLAAPPFAAAQSPSAAAARLPGAASVEDATTITQGWAFLAQGDLARAAEKARAAVAANPRDGAALLLAVEVEIARGGAYGALQFYAQWLGPRALEEPVVLRRIAHASLREGAWQRDDPALRLAAARALSAEGDRLAVAAIESGVAKGSAADVRAAAALGNAAAVRTLLQELESGLRTPVETIRALGDSRSAAAVAPLTRRLADARSEVRAAAADALGRIGAPGAVTPLKGLLQDASAHVRLKAASALYRMNDLSGVPVFQALLADAEISPRGRLNVMQEMATHPDADWQAQVRALASAGEPDVRLAAAGLIAPHDPALARSVLDALAQDDNPAIRQEAERVLASEVISDLTRLRQLLQSADGLTRVQAACRIRELTR